MDGLCLFKKLVVVNLRWWCNVAACYDPDVFIMFGWSLSPESRHIGGARNQVEVSLLYSYCDSAL